MELREQLRSTLSGSYDIDRELGGGGMSRVFVARETALGRDVVIKVLPPDMAAGVSIDRFRREIQLAAQLQHPHIVPVLSAGSSESVLYYTMPFVEGESLRHRLTRGATIPTNESVRVWRDVVDALAYAHSRGIVHRDIKPENILVSNRHALVTDFGIARAVEVATGDARVTATGLSIGTPAYMSPEQAAGDPHVDHRSDLYSAGLVMYEMLAGVAPFSGASMREIAVAQLTKEPPMLIPRDASCPPALIKLVMQCLAKDPAHRPASAEDMLTQLDTVVTPAVQRGVARRAWGKQWAAIATALLIVLGAGVGWGAVTHRLPFMDPAKPAADSLRMTIVVAESKFDPADSTLASGWADGLMGELNKDPWLKPVDHKAMVDWSRSQGFPASSLTPDTMIYIAKRGRTAAYLKLTMSRAGTGYLLSAEARGARNDNSVGVEQAAVNGASDIPAAIQRIGSQLRARLHDSRPALPFSDGAFILQPVNPRAMEYFLNARPEFDKKNYIEAARLLRLAVKEDSTFVAGWGTLAATLANSNIAPAERIRAVSQVYHMRDHIRSPVERAFAIGAYWDSMNRPDSAVAAFDSLIKLLPSSQQVEMNDQGLAFNRLRRHDLAAQVFAKLIDTTYRTLGIWNSNFVNSILYQGKADQGRAEVARLRRADSTDANTLQAQYYLATATRDLDAIDALGRTWAQQQSQSAQLRSLQYRRAVAANRGRLHEFDSLSRVRSELMRSAGATNYLEEQLNRVRVAATVEGDPARARIILDSILAATSWDKIDPLDRPYAAMITALAQIGDLKRGQHYVDEWSHGIPAEFRMIDSLNVVVARGEIALAAGDAREALRLFTFADTRDCSVCFYARYARAYDQLKMSDSARVWYEKYATEIYARNPMADAFELSRTYRRLGELYEDRHEPTTAIKYYSELLKLWNRPDPVLQPVVRDIKARVDRLQTRNR